MRVICEQDGVISVADVVKRVLTYRNSKATATVLHLLVDCTAQQKSWRKYTALAYSWDVEGIRHVVWCAKLVAVPVCKVTDEMENECGIPELWSAFHRAVLSTESKAVYMSMCVTYGLMMWGKMTFTVVHPAVKRDHLVLQLDYSSNVGWPCMMATSGSVGASSEAIAERMAESAEVSKSVHGVALRWLKRVWWNAPSSMLWFHLDSGGEHRVPSEQTMASFVLPRVLLKSERCCIVCKIRILGQSCLVELRWNRYRFSFGFVLLNSCCSYC